MAGRTTLNVSLTPELQSLIDAQLESGKYGSASEVVREGLRLIDQRERQLAIRKLRAEIAIGLRELERGEVEDGEAVFAELKRELRTASKSQTTKRRASRVAR